MIQAKFSYTFMFGRVKTLRDRLCEYKAIKQHAIRRKAVPKRVRRIITHCTPFSDNIPDKTDS